MHRVTLRNVKVADEQILGTGAAAEEAWTTATQTMSVVVAAELLGWT